MVGGADVGGAGWRGWLFKSASCTSWSLDEARAAACVFSFSWTRDTTTTACGILRFVDRFGGGEGVGGILDRGHQVLMTLAVLVLGQVRGVARPRILGVVDADPEVREGDLAHLELEFWGHLRP